MNIYEKLSNIQTKLKAPKSQYNKFGKYNYRNLEDICEAVKPLLYEHKLAMTITDEPILIGDRTYIKATAHLVGGEGETITNHAYAREALTKKGMDESQITGAASSYARKYCLNGLFLIDDTKDADSMDNSKKPQKTTGLMTKEQSDKLIELCKQNNLDHLKIATAYGISKKMKTETFDNTFRQIEAHWKDNEIGPEFDLVTK